MKRLEYIYTLLARPENGSFQIRVLNLLKGYEDDEICISISELQLREDATHQGEYEALSYTWGDQIDPEHIFVQEGNTLAELSVGKNLFKALRHLRSTTEDRKLWVDAICINQHPKDEAEREEKNWSVRIMHLIYGCASSVVIWLGLGDESSRCALLALSELGDRFEFDELRSALEPRSHSQAHSKSLEKSKWDSETYQAIAALLQSPWFTRVWIRQEAFAASPASLLQIGKSTISLRSFVTAVNALANGQPVQLGKIDVSGYIEGLTLAMSVFQKAFSSILDLMSRIRTSDCTVPHDKVYGTLGMIAMSTGDSIFVEGIKVNYDRSYEQVCLDFFLHYFACKSQLRLLKEGGLCQGSEIRPTWVPDWSKPLPVWVDLSMEAAVSHGMYAEASYLGDGVFRANGVVATEIRNVAIMEKIHMGPTVTSHQLFEELNGFMKENFPPQPSDTMLESFARALCAYLPSLRAPLEELEIQRQDIIRFTMMIYKAGALEMFMDANHPDSINTFSTTIRFFRQSRLPLIFTSDDHVGVGCPTTQPGDLLCAILGVNNLMILRPAGTNHYQLVGSAFVHGLNWGEALLGPLPNDVQVLPRLMPEKGFYQPYYVNVHSGESSYWDPRLKWDELHVPEGVGGIAVINGPMGEPMRRAPDTEYFKQHGSPIQTFDLV